MRPRFTPRQLDAFVTAAELGGFTQTAQRLRLSPSAVSSLIGELETSLGFAVFERTTRKVTLTAAGRDFLPSAMAVLRQISLAEVSAEDVRDRSVDVVRICAPLALAAIVLPPAIAEFQSMRRGVRVRVLDTGVEWLADRVATGETDMALGPNRSVGEAVDCVPLLRSTWVMWCAPQHPLASQEGVTWSEVAQHEVFAAGRDHEHTVAPMLGEKALRSAPIHVVENVTTALGMAAANLGITLCPAYVAPLAQPMGLIMREVREPSVERYISLYLPTRRTPTPAAAEFAGFLRGRLLSDVKGPSIPGQPAAETAALASS